MIRSLERTSLAEQTLRATLAAPQKRWFDREWLAENRLVAVAERVGHLASIEMTALAAVYRATPGVIGVVHQVGYHGSWGYSADVVAEDLAEITRELGYGDYMLMPQCGAGPHFLVVSGAFEYRVIAAESATVAEWIGMPIPDLRQEFDELISYETDPLMVSWYRQVSENMDW